MVSQRRSEERYLTSSKQKKKTILAAERAQAHINQITTQ
jgi:hypothetical protein